MNQRNILSAAVLCLGLSVACGGATDGVESEQQAGEQQGTTPGNAVDREETGGQANGRPEPINAQGCLTQANGQFVLTTLQTQDGTTEVYQLINADDDVRQHVGREVRVAGEAEPARIAEVREATPPTGGAAGTTGQAGASGQQPQAQVSTEARTRLEMRRLSVINVTPTGDPCPTGGAAR